MFHLGVPENRRELSTVWSLHILVLKNRRAIGKFERGEIRAWSRYKLSRAGKDLTVAHQPSTSCYCHYHPVLFFYELSRKFGINYELSETFSLHL